MVKSQPVTAEFKREALQIARYRFAARVRSIDRSKYIAEAILQVEGQTDSLG